MIVLPAIDLKDGRCVRLKKGDFGTVSTVAESPAAAAADFEKAGAEWLHMVDLDGAKTGTRANREVVRAVAARGRMKIELGGGVRDMAAVEDCLSLGVSRVIIGSAALQNPALVREAAAKYGERIAVGIDAKNGRVSAEGWLADSAVDYLTLAKKMEAAGVRTIIFTDIGRDGMLAGPNFGQLAALQASCGCRIIASGGVSGIGDIRRLAAAGLYGAICGKAVYSGALDLKQAIAEGGGGHAR